MKNLEKPEPYANVWITYKENGEERTDLGFYTNLFDHYSIPPGWTTHRIGNFYGKLPSGFGGKQINHSDVISWKYEEVENKQ